MRAPRLVGVLGRVLITLFMLVVYVVDCFIGLYSVVKETWEELG